jgi:hypothetical protein
MTLGETVYQAAYAGIPEARATMLLADGFTTIPCMCTSVEMTRTSTEFGQTETPSCVVRLLKSSEVTTGLEQGKVVTLNHSSGTAFKLRINARKNVSGLVSLLMIAESQGA